MNCKHFQHRNIYISYIISITQLHGMHDLRSNQRYGTQECTPSGQWSNYEHPMTADYLNVNL